MSGTNEVYAIRAVYDELTDTMFVFFEDGYDLTAFDHEEELVDDVHVQYALSDKKLVSAELWHASKHGFTTLPIDIETRDVILHISERCLLNDPDRDRKPGYEYLHNDYRRAKHAKI